MERHNAFLSLDEKQHIQIKGERGNSGVQTGACMMTQVSRSYLKVLKRSTAQQPNLQGNMGFCAGAGDLLTM